MQITVFIIFLLLLWLAANGKLYNIIQIVFTNKLIFSGGGQNSGGGSGGGSRGGG